MPDGAFEASVSAGNPGQSMGDATLLSIIEQEEANSISTTTGKLAEQRRQAYQYYYGEPYGNEVEGRSQIVTTEVKDAVEGVMPALMAMFTAGDYIIRCDPRKQNDEAAAAQATDYLQYIFTEENDGFTLLYCLFKDALLLKNGYCKAYWEDYEDRGIETYYDLTDPEFQQMMLDPELTLEKHTEFPDPTPVRVPAAPPGMPPMPAPPAMTLHDAVFRRNKKYGKVCLEPTPPEEVLISRECPNDLTKARFVEHRTRRTLSQIREMGFEIADDIADHAPNAEFNMERFERNRFDDAWAWQPDQGNSDPSTRTVWLCDVTMRVDFDQDGFAELRRIIKVGRNVLENKEIDSGNIVGGTAILMPHKHYGLSIYDLIGDIQLTKSMVTRQCLDNAYVANNGRMEVVDGMVNMDDLLISRPNGIVRTKAPGMLKRMENPLLGAPFYSLLEYLDSVKQSRVGVMNFPNGAPEPADAVNMKAGTAQIVHTASQERIQLMGRILAETLVKPLFLKILELVSKHQQKSKVVKLRGQWVEVDPREWKDRFDLTVTVGLGTGTQQTDVQGAMAILNVQQGAIMQGKTNIVSDSNIYAAMHRLAKSIFPKDADAMFTNPATVAPPQPKPDVDMEKIKLAAQKAAMGNKQKYDKMIMDYKLAQDQMALAMKEMGVATFGKYADMQHENMITDREALHATIARAVELGVQHSQHQDRLIHDHRVAQQQSALPAPATAKAEQPAHPQTPQVLMIDHSKQLEDIAPHLSKIAEGQSVLAEGQAKMAELLAAQHGRKKRRVTKVIRDEKGNLVGSESTEAD